MNNANNTSIKLTRTVCTVDSYGVPSFKKEVERFHIIEGSISEGALTLSTTRLGNAGFPAELTLAGSGNWILDICNDSGWKKEFVRLAR